MISGLSAAEAERPRAATKPAKADSFNVLRMRVPCVLSTYLSTVMTLPLAVRIVAISVALPGVGGCERTATPATKPSAPSAVTKPSLTRFEYAKIYMGVRTRLIVYASDETTAVNACRAAFD